MPDPVFILGSCCTCQSTEVNSIAVSLTSSSSITCTFGSPVFCTHIDSSDCDASATFTKGTDWTSTCPGEISTNTIPMPSSGGASNNVSGGDGCSCPPDGDWTGAWDIGAAVDISFQVDPSDLTKCQVNITLTISGGGVWINKPPVCGDNNVGTPVGSYSTGWFDFTTLTGTYTIDADHFQSSTDGGSCSGVTYLVSSAITITIS